MSAINAPARRPGKSFWYHSAPQGTIHRRAAQWRMPACPRKSRLNLTRIFDKRPLHHVLGPTAPVYSYRNLDRHVRARRRSIRSSFTTWIQNHTILLAGCRRGFCPPAWVPDSLGRCSPFRMFVFKPVKIDPPRSRWRCSCLGGPRNRNPALAPFLSLWPVAVRSVISKVDRAPLRTDAPGNGRFASRAFALQRMHQSIENSDI